MAIILATLNHLKTNTGIVLTMIECHKSTYNKYRKHMEELVIQMHMLCTTGKQLNTSKKANKSKDLKFVCPNILSLVFSSRELST